MTDHHDEIRACRKVAGLLRRRLWGLAIAASFVLAAQTPASAQTATASLRIYGNVSASFSGQRAVFRCEDPRHADILLGKLLADLFWSAGDTHRIENISVAGHSVAVHLWPPYGVIAVGRAGAMVLAVGAADKADLARKLSSEPAATAGKFITNPEQPYPVALDFYDLRAFKFYTEAMNSPRGLGLESHWPFVKNIGAGGLAFQNLALCDSPAPGVTMWANSDYEVREAERQHGLVVPSVEVAGVVPFWLRNQFPSVLAQPNPDALMIGWQMPALSNSYCQSWGAPLDFQQDYCLSFLKQVIDRYDSSPALGGWQFYAGEPGAELGFHDRTTENLDYSPQGQESFRNYLRKVKGYSLAQLGRRWFADPGHYASWKEVDIPDLHGFFGNLNSDCLRINQGWAWLPKDQAGSSGSAPGPDANWLPIEMPPSEEQVALPQPAAYYRVRFNASEWCALHAGKSVFLICDPGVSNVDGTRVWLNGSDLGSHKAREGGYGPFGLEISSLIKPGFNDLILLVPHEGKIIGPVFLTTTEPSRYPLFGAQRNAQYVDTLAWQTYSLYVLHDTVFSEARRRDPDRPMGLGSDEFGRMGGEVAALAQDYGLSVQNTGRESWYFPWWPALGVVDDFYATSESGGTPDEPSLTRMLSWILFDGDSSTMLFQNIESFQELEKKDRWFTRHKGAFGLEGKALREKPKIALFRSTTTSLVGDDSPWTWDIGRGELQASHFDNVYVTEHEIASGRIDDYPIVFDCGSKYMDASTVEGLVRYVENGGTFIALQNTGLNTPTQAKAYPISALTGYDALSTNQGGTVKFGENLPVFNLWAGRSFDGGGNAVDYRGANSAGNGLSLKASAPGTTSLAAWNDGSTAIGFRKLGKGRVIVLGSSFWRAGKDVQGVWQSQSELEKAFFDRLFTDLGVTRSTSSASSDVWTRKFTTKNGLNDWVVAINSGPMPVNTSISLAAAARPSEVWDAATGEGVPFTYANGWITVPNVNIDVRENRVFAVRRAGLAEGIPFWWNEKLRFWKRCSGLGSAIKISSEDRIEPSDPAGMATIPAEHWKFRTIDPGTIAGDAWMKPGFDDHGWRSIDNGPWNFQYGDLSGYRGSALYRLRFTPPASWSGHKIELGFRAVHVPLIYGHGDFAVNGTRVASYDYHVFDGEAFNYDVTPQIHPGENVLSITISSSGLYGGVGGGIWLAAEPTLTGAQDIASDWNKIGEDRKTALPVSFPGMVRGRYLSRIVQAPAAYADRNVILHIETPFQWIGLIMVNGHPIYYNSMGTAFGTRVDASLAPFFEAGKPNRIEIWPFYTEPPYSGNEASQEADMNISSIAIGCE